MVVDHDTVDEQPVLEGVQVRARPHFGTMGVAPREADMVDTVDNCMVVHWILTHICSCLAFADISEHLFFLHIHPYLGIVDMVEYLI